MYVFYFSLLSSFNFSTLHPFTKVSSASSRVYTALILCFSAPHSQNLCSLLPLLVSPQTKTPAEAGVTIAELAKSEGHLALEANSFFLFLAFGFTMRGASSSCLASTSWKTSSNWLDTVSQSKQVSVTRS